MIRRSVEELERVPRSGPKSALKTLNPDLEGEAAARSNRIFSSGVSFNNVLMQLRKLCNHPFLVLEDMATIPNDLYYNNVVTASGKMCVLERLLQQLLPNGHKVLIFSQMTTTLDIIQGYLQGVNIDCFRLDGGTSREDREENIAAFTSGSMQGPSDNDAPGMEREELVQSPNVYLLSTRAGGVGINLQAADTVIFFDSDWNPQADLQAMSRAHRLGQTKTVLVLRLVTPGDNKGIPSAEQRILRAAAHKLAAERVILADGEFDMGTSIQGGRKKKTMNEEEEEVPVLSAEAGVLSLFASDASTSESQALSSSALESATEQVASSIIDTTVAAATATAAAVASSCTSVEGIASLSDDYIKQVCKRDVGDIFKDASTDSLSSVVGASVDTNAVKVVNDESENSCNSDNQKIAATTMPLASDDFACALEWRDWLGMPEGFEKQWAEELARLKLENRERLARLQRENRERREKEEQEEEEIKRAIRASVLEKEKEAQEAQEAKNSSKNRRSPRKFRKAPPKEAEAEDAVEVDRSVFDIASATKEKDLPAEKLPSRSSPRVRPGGRVIHSEDLLWDKALLDATAEAEAENKECSSGDSRKNTQKTRKAVEEEVINSKDVCVLCNSFWSISTSSSKRPVGRPPKKATSSAPSTPYPPRRVSASDADVFDLPTDENFLSLSEKQREHLLLICDSCGGSFHMNCIGLNEVPRGEWSCLLCEFNARNASSPSLI